MPGTRAVLKGVIHGQTIELDEMPNLPDGQQVHVTIEPVESRANAEDSLDALKRAAGSWSDDPEGLDRFLDWNRQQRKLNRREVPE